MTLRYYTLSSYPIILSSFLRYVPTTRALVLSSTLLPYLPNVYLYDMPLRFVPSTTLQWYAGIRMQYGPRVCSYATPSTETRYAPTLYAVLMSGMLLRRYQS